MATITDTFVMALGVPATLYNADGITNPVPAQIIVSDALQVKLLGPLRSDIFEALLLSTVLVVQGQVLSIPALPAGWFLIARATQIAGSLFPRGPALTLLALPMALSVQRVATLPTGSALNPYDEPALVDNMGHPTGVSISTVAVRAGVLRASDPLLEQPEGAIPAGVSTLYTMLGASVGRGDQITLPTGELAIVTQTNQMASGGGAYALGLVCQTSAGKGWA